MPSPPLAPVKRTHANLTPVALAFGGNALLLLVIACAQRRALGLVKRKTFTLIGRQDDDDLDMIVDDKSMPTIPCLFEQDRDPMDEEARAGVDGETRQVDVNEGEGRELAEEDQDELDSDEDVEEDHGVEGPEDHDEDGAHEEDDVDDEDGKDKMTKPLTKPWCSSPKGNQVYVMDI